MIFGYAFVEFKTEAPPNNGTLLYGNAGSPPSTIHIPGSELFIDLIRSTKGLFVTTSLPTRTGFASTPAKKLMEIPITKIPFKFLRNTK